MDKPFAPAASLTRFAWLSIAAALLTLGLKTLAWKLTGSVGLFSDALESLVNLAGASMALAMLIVAAKPADAEHAYGHGKAEYFSSGFEGLLIILASTAIGIAALERFLHPKPLAQLDIGLAVSVGASLINLVVALVLLRAGRQHRSLTLEADGQHLLTDVWTTAGVIAGVASAAFTGWLWLDPVLALLVAANILWTGWSLISRSADGLMDGSLSPEDQVRLSGILDRYRGEWLDFHALRTRESGSRLFIEFHVLVPGAWSVQRGHDVIEKLEQDIIAAFPHAVVTAHLEPIEDPVSHSDANLDR